jgi:hypothetical protein
MVMDITLRATDMGFSLAQPRGILDHSDLILAGTWEFKLRPDRFPTRVG